MATLTDWIKQMQNQAGTTANPAPTTRKSPMELMVTQQAMAQNSDAKTLAGLAIGKLLRGLFDDWKSRYDARGAQNDRILDPNTPPEERNKLLEQIGLDDASRAERLARQAGERGINVDYIPQVNSPPTTSGVPAPQSQIPQAPQTPQRPEIGGFNPNARAVQQATAKLLGDTDFWTQRATETDTPQTQPWDDAANWDKWRNLLNGVGWQSNGLRF